LRKTRIAVQQPVPCRSHSHDDAGVKYVMTYRAVEDFLPLARENGPAHVARLHQFSGRGELLMVGTFDEPMNGDAMGIFTSREAAEEFIAGDPFVLNGVVANWTVRPWNEVLRPEPS
jgi:uncharacterized protein YciI